MSNNKKQFAHKVVIFGENHHNTLGLIRSLGEAGLKSYLIVVNTNRKTAFISKSKYIIKSWIVSSVEEGLNVLLNQFKSEKFHPVLFPTFDTEVKIISSNYNKLEKYFLLPSIECNSWSLEQCLNKQLMDNFAEKQGLLVPKSWTLNYNERYNLPNDIIYPCVLKAIDSASGPKTYDTCNNEIDLQKSIEDLGKYCKTFQIQEYIDKKTEIILLGWSNGKGNTVIPGIIDKVRQYPKGFGATAMANVAKVNNNYLDLKLVHDYVNALKYSGLFSIEFIISKNNKAYFLEINLRNDGNGYAPTFGGVNLPYQWYLSITNNTTELSSLHTTFNSDFIFMSEFNDLLYALKNNYPIKSWIKDYLKSDCYLYWNRHDIFPYIFYLYSRLKHFINKRHEK